MQFQKHFDKLSQKSMITSTYEKSLDERIKESTMIRKKYPERIPVICTRSPQSQLDVLQKTKYLIPKDFTAIQFMYVIRKRLKLTKESALFIFINGCLPTSGRNFSDLYDEYKHEDGFLYLFYSNENTFG